VQTIVYEKNREILIEKNPFLALTFSFFSNEHTHQNQDVFDKDPSDTAEVVFVLGIGDGSYYKRIKSFLSKDKKRRVFFWETNLHVLDLFLYSDHAELMLKDPQVVIRYVSKEEEWVNVIRQALLLCPSDKVDFIPSSRFKILMPERIEHIKYTIFTEATLIFSSIKEILYPLPIAKNILTNYRTLSIASYVNQLENSFEGIPFIICGAGPSLDTCIEDLKNLSSRAVIVAVGSACAALSNKGIIPHICMAADPNEEEVYRFKESQVFSVPFFFSPRVHRGVFNLLSSDLGFMSCGIGGDLELWMEKNKDLTLPHIGVDLPRESLSITTMAISLARMMGASSIILSGVDLAFIESERYAQGVHISSYPQQSVSSASSHQLITATSIDGRPVSSLVHWMMEASAIAQFAKKYSDISFYNTSTVGLPIDGVTNKTLMEIFLGSSFICYDIRGKIHSLMQIYKVHQDDMELNHEKILLESLLRVKDLVTVVLQDLKSSQKYLLEYGSLMPSVKTDLAIMEIKEELSFDLLFSYMLTAIETTILREYLISDNPSLDEKSLLLDREIVRWTHISKTVQRYLEFLLG